MKFKQKQVQVPLTEIPFGEPFLLHGTRFVRVKLAQSAKYTCSGVENPTTLSMSMETGELTSWRDSKLTVTPIYGSFVEE